MLADESHGFLTEVAAFGDGPLVVLFEQDGADESDYQGVVGEDRDHVGAALDLLLIRSSGFVLEILRQCALGNEAYAVTSPSAAARISAALGNRSVSMRGV